MLNTVAVKIDYIDEKGFGYGSLESGKICKVAGVLPGEVVEVESYKTKKGTIQANLVKILKLSTNRIKSVEESYLSTSPFQIANYNYENQWKKNWVKNQFLLNNIELPNFEIYVPKEQFGYRNKVEFSFFSDDQGLHLAFHKRSSSRGKIIVDGSKLLPDRVNEIAQYILSRLQTLGLSARDLKTMLIRYSLLDSTCVASVFYRNQELNHVKWQDVLNNNLVGFNWIFSNPKSPASIVTTVTQTLGVTDLRENINNTILTYPYDGFFQINPPAFTQTVRDVLNFLQNIPSNYKINLIDLYAGVGTIGISIGKEFQNIFGIELFENSKKYAENNAKNNGINNFYFTQVGTEKIESLEMPKQSILIVDPPRAGLLGKAIDNILSLNPQYIIYLSCNPATQAKDLSVLSEKTNIEILFNKAYNYYPRTMHVENLLILKTSKK